MKLSIRHAVRVGIPIALLVLTALAVLPRAGSRSALAGVEAPNGVMPSAQYCGPVVGVTTQGGTLCVTTNDTGTGIATATLIDYPTVCGLLNLSQTFNPNVPIVGDTFTYNGQPFNFQGTFVGKGGEYDEEFKSIAGDLVAQPEIEGFVSVAEGSPCDGPGTNDLRVWTAFFEGTVPTVTPTPTVVPTETATVTVPPCQRNCGTVTVTPSATAAGCTRNCTTVTVTPSATVQGCTRNCATATVTVTATVPVCQRNCGTVTVTPSATAPACPRNCPTFTPTATVVQESSTLFGR